ncbi:hypothetical protein R9X47_24265 [Wukongibacter baidiensis]|uniref:hypothetical protein n=1 Tax=Wukongibacter baidiensis TaxID=1723361 RepID=UPI003D7F4D4E
MDLENNKKGDGCRPFLIGCGAIFGIIILAVILFFVWIAGQPEGGVLFSNEIEEYALEYIKEHNILNNTEELIAYYDCTLSLDGTEAALLTNERIIYHKKGSTNALNLIDVVDVKHRYEDIDGDIIEITNKDGKLLKIEIDPDNNGESFYNALIGTLEIKGIKIE